MTVDSNSIRRFRIPFLLIYIKKKKKIYAPGNLKTLIHENVDDDELSD